MHRSPGFPLPPAALTLPDRKTMLTGVWGLRRHTILLVSETHPDPKISPAFLRQPDIRLVTAERTDQAMEKANREHPNLIIEDLRSPSPEGLDLCRKLKSTSATREIPLLLVAPPDLRKELQEVGPDALVLAPIVQRDYFDAVRRFVPLPKRRHPRHSVNLRFIFRYQNLTAQAFSRDLSPDGALLHTDVRLAEQARVELGFHIPGEEREIHCGGVVRRVVPRGSHQFQTGGIAVEFDGLSEDDRESLEGFLERLDRRRAFFL